MSWKHAYKLADVMIPAALVASVALFIVHLVRWEWMEFFGDLAIISALTTIILQNKALKAGGLRQ